MKILLVNDTRGVHEYLYRGLIELGHECDLAVIGTKPIAPVANLKEFDPLRKWGIVGKLFRPFINLWEVNKLPYYDAASFIHRISFIAKPSFLQYIDLPVLSSKFGIMSYTALGCDELGYIHANAILPYRPCTGCERFDTEVGKYCINVIRKTLHSKAAKLLNRHFDVVTSPAIEYDHIGEIFHGPFERIPFAVDLSEIPWKPARHKVSKLNIIHTPSRKGFKGTDVVLAAIEILQKKRNDFEFNLIHGLSWEEYIEAVSAADVVIDQVWSQSSGMNGLWLLGMGKVVLSGNTQLCKDYFSFGNDNPIIDAPPDAQLLAEKLISILNNKAKIPQIIEQGRNYLEKNHNYMNIAQQYVDTWKSI